MENFTPLSATIGGILIGLAATMLLLTQGRIAGISNILGGLLETNEDDRLWRILFIVGLIVGSSTYVFFGENTSNININPFQLNDKNHMFFMILGGLLVGFGLAVSSMINPAKIVGFLDITGNWDPSLAFVMGGAVFVTALTFRLILKRPKPIFTDIFELPSKVSLDGKLITGAAIFGIGWAMSGLCPGPAISSIGFLDEKLLIFVCTLLIGSFIGKKWR